MITYTTLEQDLELIATHFQSLPAPAIEALQELCRTGLLHVSRDTRGADTRGIYEERNGNCLRDFDRATDRQVSRLEIVTTWLNPDGSRYGEPQ